MLYKTHQKFAQVFGVTGLTVAFSSGMMPTFDAGYGLSDNLLIGAMILVGYSSSTFGGEFPDIDSATSVPARRYPTLRRLFKIFGVNHRGKFSHDFVSLGILFGALLLGAMLLFNLFWSNWVSMILLSCYIIYFYGREVGNELVFFLIKGEDNRKRMRMPAILVSAVAVAFLFMVMGWLPVSSSPSTLLRVSSALKPITYVTIIFVWIGAYSHLFADMLTNEGVYIFWRKISPAKWVMRLNKVPFLIPLLVGGLGWLAGQLIGAVLGLSLGLFMQYMVAKTDLKTGSEYEKVVRRIVKFLLIPMTLLLIYTAFGGVLAW